MSTKETTKAMERIVALVDAGSFVEIGGLVTARNTDFALLSQAVPGDGVITGYATIGEKLCYIYSQDATVFGGSMGEMHAKKIVKLYDMAMKMGAPVIGLVDCAGLRLEEATDALDGFGQLYLSQAKASGMIPQILCVFGKCGGGMAISAGMADFVFMEGKKAELFVNAPNTLDGNYKEKCNTAGAEFQAENTGIVDGFGSEDEILTSVRALVDILPANNDDVAVGETMDDLNRLTADLEGVTDIRAIASHISDGYVFVETKKDFAKDMVTGFIRLDGVTCGILGNAETTFSPDGLAKAALFVSFCDAFEIPVITLTNVAGYVSSAEAEKRLAKTAAKFVYTMANATVPKINVILSEAMGSPYVIMNSKAVGADIVYAIEDATIGIMDSAMAAKIIASEVGELADIAEKFDDKQTAVAAAGRGYVDEIITMTTVRKHLLAALEMLYNKRETAPLKKHGTK